MSSTSADAGLSFSPATIAGIVIGVVAGVALLAGACLYLRSLGGSRGRFTQLRKRRAVVDPDEEFVSRGPSIHIRDRGYGHGQHPSVSRQPLLISSPPETYTVSGPPLLRDGSYIPSSLDSLLPPIDFGHFSLYEVDDPYARLERAILPVSRAHHIPLPHELDQLSRNSVKHSGPSSPHFINRTLSRPLGPELSSGRTGSSLFSPAELLQSTPSPSDATQMFESRNGPLTIGDTGDGPRSKSRRIISATALSERTDLTESREEAYPPHKVGGEALNAESAEFTHPQASTLYTSDTTDRHSRTSFRRLPNLPGLSPFAEGPTVIDTPHSHDMPMSTEIGKKPSVSFSELEKSSSLSVALSHCGPSTRPEHCTFPLLSSDAFRKGDSTSSSHRWTTCSSSGRATRYPSLTPSSLLPSSSSSNRHSDSAAEWRRPPAGLAALTNIQLEPIRPSPPSTPREIPDLPLPHNHRPSTSPAANQRCEVKPHRAHLRAHSPGSVPKIWRGSIVKSGIASIDVLL